MIERLTNFENPYKALNLNLHKMKKRIYTIWIIRDKIGK